MKYFYSIIQKIVELKNVNNSNLGKIFIFHQIVEGKPNNIYQVSLDSFKKFINLLNDIGKIKDLRQLSDEGSNNDFYITFDDVHYNAYQNAMLWLIESGIPFTVFITCDFINKNNYISLKELKYLSKNNLCTIGSHSITHPILRKLNSIGIYNEIINSKIILKKLIEKDI